MSLENKVKLLERIAKISGKISHLILCTTVLMLVYFIVLGR